jgi:tetraacyldisaccharide 4'-kinase
MDPELPVYYMRVEIEILAGQENWQSFIDRLIKSRDLSVPERFY